MIENDIASPALADNNSHQPHKVSQLLRYYKTTSDEYMPSIKGIADNFGDYKSTESFDNFIFNGTYYLGLLVGPVMSNISDSGWFAKVNFSSLWFNYLLIEAALGSSRIVSKGMTLTSEKTNIIIQKNTALLLAEVHLATGLLYKFTNKLYTGLLISLPYYQLYNSQGLLASNYGTGLHVLFKYYAAIKINLVVRAGIEKVNIQNLNIDNQLLQLDDTFNINKTQVAAGIEYQL